MLVFSGADYEVIDRELGIDPATTRITVGVEIIDDSTCEDKEVFSLSTSLLSSDDPISIVNDIRITITDDDCCTYVIHCLQLYNIVASTCDRIWKHV